MEAQTKFDPRNRYILLSAAEPSVTEASPTILIPDDYQIKTNPYGVYTLEQVSADCQKVSLDDIGKLVMVNDTMVETASLAQGDFLLIQENHIYGVIG